MSSTLLAVDGGESTGLVMFQYSDTKPAELVRYAQVENGIAGFKDWLDNYDWPRPDHVVQEAFTPLQHSGFSLTRKSVTPLLIEGALVMSGLIQPYEAKSPQHQRPAEMYFTGGRDLADKKKRAHKWLKEHGLYVTGKDVGCKDANDVRSALLHGITWFRKQKHAPTLKRFFGGNE